MRLSDVEIWINYFHHASVDDLHTLGVDRALLPTQEAWHSLYEEDYARPIQDRVNFSVVWEFDGRAVGFSSVPNIAFGKEAFMHMHVLSSTERQGV